MTPLEELKRLGKRSMWTFEERDVVQKALPDLVRAVEAAQALLARIENPAAGSLMPEINEMREALAALVPAEEAMPPHPNRGEHEEEIARLEAVVKAQAEQLRIFEANCCYRYIELDDRARLAALKEQK